MVATHSQWRWYCCIILHTNSHSKKVDYTSRVDSLLLFELLMLSTLMVTEDTECNLSLPKFSWKLSWTLDQPKIKKQWLTLIWIHPLIEFLGLNWIMGFILINTVSIKWRQDKLFWIVQAIFWLETSFCLKKKQLLALILSTIASPQTTGQLFSQLQCRKPPTPKSTCVKLVLQNNLCFIVLDNMWKGARQTFNCLYHFVVTWEAKFYTSDK